ncbi:MAG: DNA primase [Muribaculaceae bacterium]|nr:DNA primase [Muribaculaceae bacterium]
MISEQTISKVRDLEILDIVKPYVSLTRKGSNYVGICPFHPEKTGSFSVNATKNFYYCFSCHRGGDGIHFIREKESLGFSDAVEFLAKEHNIPVEKINSEKNDEEKREIKHRESLLVTMEMIHGFFTDCLNKTFDEESDRAKNYAYNRWPSDFCNIIGIGYAPINSSRLYDYIKQKSLSEEILLELGILKRADDGKIYPLFRERIMIPIRDKWGRTIGFTGRYIGKNNNPAKYFNSANSSIYQKSKSLFGIEKASRNKKTDYVIIVEGAPDVLRLQSIGFNNVVASLGTTWNESQFEQLKKITNDLCFIPDSDYVEGEPFGPGFKAVMDNGSLAIRKGFNVTVREIPFSEEVIEVQPEGKSSEGDSAEKEKRKIISKNDPDSYIIDKEYFYSLDEKLFIVWYAEKKFSIADSLIKERQFISEIADLLRYIDDQLIFDQCIEQLSKIHGKQKLWKDAVSKSRIEARKKSDGKSIMDERQKDVELLRQFNLFIRDNCYYTNPKDEEEPLRISNFIMEPLFHIEDENNGSRIFRLRNMNNESRVIELRESEMCSLNAFQQRVGSLGNYVWPSKIDKLNRVKEYLYSKTRTAERIKKLGWDDKNDFFAFGNGIFQSGKFRETNELGIVEADNGNSYYLPATSNMYRNNDEIYQFERLMIHENCNGIKFSEYIKMLTSVFGNNASVAVCYLVATLFRDIVFRKTRHFPILNLFGEKGTGKTTLATCLQSFFLHGIDPPNLGVTSVPAMNDRISQAVNILVIFDEYKNDLDLRKIAYLKGIWGGGGQTKKNTNSDGKATQTLVSTGVVLCGQDKPTQDMALFTRLIYLPFSKTSFNSIERKRYEELVSMCNLGMTHLTLEIQNYRHIFERNFKDAYSMVKQELSEKTKDEEIHDRVFGNWVIILATFRTLEAVLDFPFSYTDLFETAIKGLRVQNEMTQESSEIADFWSNLQGYQVSGKCIDGTHFKIKYLTAFRPIGIEEDTVFMGAKPILYLNVDAIATVFSGRANNVTANRSNWSTILTYLKTHESYLGLKQERFTILGPNGTPEYLYEQVGSISTKRKKTHRPKALCFDYSILKEKFGLDLETELVSDDSE